MIHSDHIHNNLKSGRHLLASILLNFIITIAQVVGGLLSNSLALLSDSLHNLSDVIALIISYLALLIGRWGNDLRRTFGYKRVEILAALANTTILIIVAFFLFREAYFRLFEPVVVNTTIMGLIAFVGLLANLGSALLLKKDALTNINIKSAYLHLISDTVTSVAVILGAIIIQFLHIYYVDAILTFLIGGYVLFSSYKILREALSILMQSAPEHIDILELKERIEKIPEVNNIHHVHLWRLSDQDVLFEGHVDLERNYTVAETDIIRSNIEKILRSQYNIDHVTIQIEFGCCPEKDVIKKI